LKEVLEERTDALSGTVLKPSETNAMTRANRRQKVICNNKVKIIREKHMRKSLWAKRVKSDRIEKKVHLATEVQACISQNIQF